MKLTAVFEPAEEGGYVCWLEEMPGVQSQGQTVAEARANLIDALRLSLEYLREKARQESSPRSARAPGNSRSVKLVDVERHLAKRMRA